MLRMIGAALVLCGAGGFGLMKSLQYHRQVRQLRELIGAVEILKCELNYTMLPLAKLFHVAAERLDGACGRFFEALSGNITQGMARKKATEQALADTHGLCLPNDALLCLVELCSSLGRYDMDGENRLLQLSGQRLKSALERTEAEKKPLAKS